MSFRNLATKILDLWTKVNPQTRKQIIKIGLGAGLITGTALFIKSRVPNRQLFIENTAYSNSSVSFTSPSRQNHNFIVNITKQCAPSVVSIEIKDPNRISPETGGPMTASTGSGFVVKQNGWILTNAHVVMNKPNSIVLVHTPDGNEHKATVHDVDMKIDLALLKIPCDNLTPLKFGKSGDISPGEWVVALGSPLSLRHTITAGIVSSVNRNAEELGINSQTMKFIQTDAAITFGHSGGPLVNLDGEVVGINNLRITAGIAFAIPIEYAKEFLNRSSVFSSDEKQVKPVALKQHLGITTLSLSQDIMTELLQNQNITLPEGINGVLVWKVLSGTPAHKAGLRAGDIITHLNGKPVLESGDIYILLKMYDKQSIVFSIYRYGEKTEIELKTQDRT